MQELKRGNTPTPRGLYLFTWGIVYLSLSVLFMLPLAEPTNPLFAGVFAVTSAIVIASSWWHRLDNLAFSVLVAATAFRALWHIFDLSDIVGARPSLMFMWTAVAISHFIVSKWPYITDRELEEQAIQYKMLYEDAAEQNARMLEQAKEHCPCCNREG